MLIAIRLLVLLPFVACRIKSWRHLYSPPCTTTYPAPWRIPSSSCHIPQSSFTILMPTTNKDLRQSRLDSIAVVRQIQDSRFSPPTWPPSVHIERLARSLDRLLTSLPTSHDISTSISLASGQGLICPASAGASTGESLCYCSTQH